MNALRWELRDVEGRGDLAVIVEDFYDRVRQDEILGPIFDDVAKVHWETHLPKIVDFWDTALFRSGAYRGNPLKPHLDLGRRVAMTWDRFERWLDLFFATVDTHFRGERADHLKRIAADMAAVMSRRIETRSSEAL